MKTTVITICSTLLLASALCLHAAESGTTRSASPELERMKTLVGTWTGTTDMGQGPIDITLEYRLIAGGTVLEERCFPGTPNEMVTMYYDQNGRLAMTHYCTFGNRPAMKLKSSDATTITFDFDPTCGINPKKESHMHALSITFEGTDTIKTSCKAFMDGQAMEEKPTTLKRMKP